MRLSGSNAVLSRSSSRVSGVGALGHVQTRRSARQGRLGSVNVVNMIGFDFGDREEEPDDVIVRRSEGAAMIPTPARASVKVSSLATLGSSLLVYSQVMKGSVGEAFLASLSASIKYQAPSKDLLGAYSRFYSLLQAAGSDAGWEDYVLDQILLARDNAFARAVAQGGKLDASAPVLKAVAYDLDVLQNLCVPMKSLADYIGGAAPVAGPYWVSAASSASMKPTKKSGASSGPQVGINMSSETAFIAAPPTADELSAWKAAIANKAEWSEAVPILQQYYAMHGFGITSRNAALRWSKGAFEEGNEGGVDLPQLFCLASQQLALAENTSRFCDGLPAQHVLVAGPSGSGKSWLLWEATLAAGKSRGIRVVDVGSAEMGAVLEAARGAGRYPRVRFILVVDNVSLPLRGGGLASDLMAGLSGTGGSGWPSNCLLYMGATADSTVSISDPIVSRFGMFLTTGFLSEGEFEAALIDMGADKEAVGPALAWAQQRGLTVRSAWQYLQAARTISK